MSGGFQQQVYSQPALGVAGDFASVNPYFTFDAGPGGLIAGSAGLVIGRFAWAFPPLDSNSAPQVAQNFGYGPVSGFVHRAQQGLNSVFLSDAGMTILGGLPVTLMTGGDFLVVNAGSQQATSAPGSAGNKAFANLLTGAVSFATAGSFPSSASDSGGAVVNTTLTMVGGVSGNILTVASISAGAVYVGAVLTSNAVGQVTSQLTGTANGVGTYELSIGEQSVAAGTTIGGNYGVYTVGTATGTFAVGMQLSGGTTLPANTVLTTLLSGTGGNGSTFATNSGTGAQTSHALVGSTVVETKWYATSQGLTGELVKISDHPLG